MEQKTRIVWVDLFKALAILFVVVGHSTGRFNGFIYQFHMAAFFLISGYTSRIGEKDLETVAVSKLHTIILPLFTAIGLVAAARAAKALLLSQLTLGEAVFYVAKCFGDYLIYGAADSMLGASWFLPVLFFIFVVQRLIWRLSGGRDLWRYALLSLAVYLLGYAMERLGYRQTHGFDLVGIGQLFFAMGVVLRETRLAERLEGTPWRFAVWGAGLLLLCFLRQRGGATVDYPSRVFPGVVLTAVGPIGGILVTIGLAKLAERAGKPAVRLLTAVGNASLGVLLLHFIGFKAATALLMPFGLTTAADLGSFLLPDAMSATGWAWAFYTAVSLTFSVLLWRGMQRIPVLRVLLGRRPKRRAAAPT